MSKIVYRCGFENRQGEIKYSPVEELEVDDEMFDGHDWETPIKYYAPEHNQIVFVFKEKLQGEIFMAGVGFEYNKVSEFLKMYEQLAEDINAAMEDEEGFDIEQAALDQEIANAT